MLRMDLGIVDEGSHAAASAMTRACIGISSHQLPCAWCEILLLQDQVMVAASIRFNN